MEHIYNCHTHIFTNQHVPVKFLPLGLLRLLCRSEVGIKIGKILSGINPGRPDDYFDRFATFMNVGNMDSQLKIFELMKGFYPEGSKFVVLSMDMEFMEAGDVPSGFIEQLNELAEIKKQYPENIFPFIFAHPERPNVTELVQEYIEKHNFAGIKIYPPLGYYPFDQRLYPIYVYAETNDIPIMTHCSRGGVYYRGKITADMLIHPRTGTHIEKAKNERFTENFSDPHNYEFLLNDFPKLKICMGHFGGGNELHKYLTTSWREHEEESWFSVILNLIRRYNNFYADISYTMYDQKLHPLLKIMLQDKKLRSRILYGSDFYMVERDLPERAYSINLRAFLGEEDYQQIAETNAKEYLSTSLK